MGWLHTRHYKDKECRGEKLGDRAQLPPLEDFDQCLMVMARECGMHETSWQDIDAWVRVTGLDVGPWFAGAIRAISLTYTGSVKRYDTSKDSAPWVPVEIDREAVDRSVRNALRGRNKQ